MATTITQQVATLNPGESVVLPAGANIVSVVTDGNITVTSTCNDLPTPEEYVCIRYDFAESDAPDPGALEDGSIVSVEISGTVYPLDIGFGASISTIRDTINDSLGPIFVVYSGAKDSSYDDRAEYALGVKIPSSLISSAKLKLQGTGYPNGLYVIHTSVTDCACVTTTSGGSSTETITCVE